MCAFFGVYIGKFGVRVQVQAWKARIGRVVEWEGVRAS